MKQSTLMIGVFLLLTFMLQSVNSAPPFSIIEFDDGYILVPSELEYLQQNKDHQFNFFIYNKTDGTLQDNSTINCSFYLANSSGNVLIFLDVPYFDDGHWGINILGGNFSSIGNYAYGLKCEDGLGGAVTGTWKITPTGFETSTAQGLIYSFLILVSMFLVLISIYGAFTIDGKNEFSMGGDLINVNFNKYYKGFLFLLSYLFIIFTTYLTWQVSSQFLLLDLGTAIFKTLFNILLIGLPIIIFVLIIVGFMKWLADVELHKLAERNLKPR